MIESAEGSGASDEGSQDSAGEASVDLLLSSLLSNHTQLLSRLAVRLGSQDAAADILQEVYLKLSTRPQVREVRNVNAYLYRMAINLAQNQRRKDSRMLPVTDAMMLVLPDSAPDPEHVALASDEMTRALSLLQALPTRRRQIFLAKWRDDKTQVQIAEEFGLHKRSVQKELVRAEKYLRLNLKKSRL
jgi:RNA polymerase sigma-70 factor (ECF subfamily)